MRIERETLGAVRAGGRAAARTWANGCARKTLDEIGAAARTPELQSPGTGVISPQAATHLGHAIGEALRDDADPSGSTLTLAAALLASPNPSHRMVGPHVLTPLARATPTCAGRILQLADLCADPAAAAALAIPLSAAVVRDPSAAAASFGQSAESPPRRLALQATRQALAAQKPELARTLPEMIAKASRQAPPVD